MWKIVNMEGDYIEAVADAAREYYGSENDIADPKYLEYEYYKNPMGKVRMKLAWDEDNVEVAGQYAAIPISVNVQNQEKKVLMSVNTLTRASYRGQGIFKTLANEVYTDAIEQEFSFVYGMPNQNSYPGFLKYVGFSDLGSVPLFIRPLVPSHMVASFLNNKFFAFLARPFDFFYKLKKQQLYKADYEIVDFEENAEKYAELFWGKIKNKYSVMITRNYQYIKYRFLDIPRRDYYGYYAIKNGEVIGYAIGRVMDVANINCGMIADFLFLPGYEKEASELLSALLIRLTQNGADMAGCMVPLHSGEAKILKSKKFFVCPKFMEPQPFRFIYRSLHEKNEVVNKFENWFFTMGDYDVV